MAIRTVRTEGDPILRKISKAVKEMTPRTETLIDDMSDTLKEYNGVGLAAVQVGVLKRLCIVNIHRDDVMPQNDKGEIIEDAPEPDPTTHSGGRDIVIINPQIEVVGDEMQCGNEGCLSVPGKYGEVDRPMHIILRAKDRDFKDYELKATGLLARAIQHECDHMDGILYIDKLTGELKDVQTD